MFEYKCYFMYTFTLIFSIYTIRGPTWFPENFRVFGSFPGFTPVQNGPYYNIEISRTDCVVPYSSTVREKIVQRRCKTNTRQSDTNCTKLRILSNTIEDNGTDCSPTSRGREHSEATWTEEIGKWTHKERKDANTNNTERLSMLWDAPWPTNKLSGKRGYVLHM